MTFIIRIPPEFDTKCCSPFCDEHADLYRLPQTEREKPQPVAFLCKNHAQQFGYCWGCGDFWGGIDSFEFGPGSRVGLCIDCYHDSGCDDFEDEDNIA